MFEKKVKIGMITTISKTMDWFIVDSARNLSKNGYDVTLISNMTDDFIERNKDYAECICLDMNRGASIKDLFSGIKNLIGIFKEKKFDIIYYMSPNASMYSSVAGFLSGTKIRVYNQTGLRYVSFGGIKRLIFKLVEQITCFFSTHIKSQSPKNMEFAITQKLCSKKKISIVGIGGTVGVSLDECSGFNHEEKRKELRDKHNIPQGAFVFGYVGRINEDKGINELLSAFFKLKETTPDIYLVLVGMIDEVNPIDEEKMKLAKASDSVIMTGNVPTGEVYHHMAMFDILTHPTYREGFGKVLQEAMGMKIPIITTNVPGPSEVVENGISGILCEVKNSEALFEKMLMLYNDASQRASLAEAGYERAKKYFDRPIMLDNILKDLNKIVNIEGGEKCYDK